MRLQSLSFLFACSLIILSCTSSKRLTQANRNSPNSRSSKKFVIDGLTITPKQSTEFDTLAKSNSDTLAILVNSNFIYYPFGPINAEFKPSLGILKNFSLTIDTLKTDIGNTYLQLLKHNSSKIIFSFNSTYKGHDSDLYYGEIHDEDVKFVNKIKIGMSAEDFYAAFFDNFPVGLAHRYKYFSLMSMDGISHIYSFVDNKLKSVKFTRDVGWKLAYNPLDQ